MTPEIRHSDERDIEAIRRLYAEPSSYAATLQLPYPPARLWQKRLGDYDVHVMARLAGWS